MFSDNKYSNIIVLNNTDIDSYEMYVSKDKERHLPPDFYLLPLSYMATEGKVCTYQIDELLYFFKNMDNGFKDFLGFNIDNTKEGAIKEIRRLLNKESDKRHKYWIIGDRPGEAVGIFYIYNYNHKYKTCSLSIGIREDYRKKGLAYKVIKEVCEELLKQGFIRLELEVETTNRACIYFCEKYMIPLGFKKEGIKRNSYGVGIDSIVYSKIKE